MVIADPRNLRVLLVAARSGDLLTAAYELGGTPLAASQQLTRLEREVGRTLVLRTLHGIVLTDAGRSADAAEDIERTLNLVAARVENPTTHCRRSSSMGCCLLRLDKCAYIFGPSAVPIVRDHPFPGDRAIGASGVEQ